MERYNVATHKEEIQGLEEAIVNWKQVLKEWPTSYEARTVIRKLENDLEKELTEAP